MQLQSPTPAVEAPIRDVDGLITALAARQHGVVSRQQLVEAGLPLHRIEYRLRHGRLVAVHPGVYRTGAVFSDQTPLIAALLACGGDSMLSHRTAALLWEILRRMTHAGAIEITLRAGRRAPRAGVRVYRVATLHDDEVCMRDGLPLTTPARTLLDLAAVLAPRELERAVAIAERQNLIADGELVTLLERHSHNRGAGALRALVDGGRSPALTRSEAEDRFLDKVRGTGLPDPQANVLVEGYEVDFFWPRERVIAEVDGFAFHASPAAFERDRQRDARLTAAGYCVIRITWKQLTRDPEGVLVTLAQALAIGRMRHEGR